MTEKLKITQLTDAEFEELLEKANFIENPTNEYYLKWLEVQERMSLYDFTNTIPQGDPYHSFYVEYERYKEHNKKAKYVNTHLILQKDLSFDRLYEILVIAKKYGTEVDYSALIRVLNSMAFTISELEQIIALGYSFLQTKLDQMLNNPEMLPSPNALAIVDFATKTVELPNTSDNCFYVVDIKEGSYDDQGNHLATKRIYLPTACFKVNFTDRYDEKNVFFYPSGYCPDTEFYSYSQNTIYLWDHYMDHIDELMTFCEVAGAVVPINDSLIHAQKLSLK